MNPRLPSWHSRLIFTKGLIQLQSMSKSTQVLTAASLAKLLSQIPGNVRRAAVAVIKADSASRFHYKLSKASGQIQLFLIETNLLEGYTVCHCFSADFNDPDYAYESMPLSSIRTLSRMADELAFN